MSVGILGTKLGMTQVFNEAGFAIPVTVVQAGPCTVTQVKTPETDGYSAIQVGYGEVREKGLTKPELGHLKNQAWLFFAICTNIGWKALASISWGSNSRQMLLR